MVKCVKGHSGYFGCDRYDQKGEHKEGRMVFPELNANIRDDNSVRGQTNEDHHLSNSQFLLLNIDMVNNFSIDYMHCVCLGIMKRLLNIWLGKNCIFNHRIYRITNIGEMNSRINYLHKIIPRNIFSRHPRKVDHVGYWKATEYRLFLLYTGHIILKDLLHADYNNNFMCLSFAMLILVNSNCNTDSFIC